MKVVVDTSVLTAVMIEVHPEHGRSLAWYNRARSNEFETLICTHTLAELYAVLTRLPLKPRISPDMTRQLIRSNIEKANIGIVALDAIDYSIVLDRMVAMGLSGGVIYDALVAQAAEKIGADQIVTLNESDFRHVCPRESLRVSLP